VPDETSNQVSFMQISNKSFFDNVLAMIVTETRLRHLLSVAHHSHFGRAAESLNISQPALTKSIQGLEAALGIKLLDRERGGVVLTVFGELVLRHGQELLHNQTEMLRELRLLADLDIGHVHVMLGPYPSVVSGYKAIGRLMARHPHLGISVQVEGWRGVIAAVEEKVADLGIAELSDWECDTRFATEILGEHEARLFCRAGHPVLSKRPLSLADLAAYPWVSTRLPPRVAELFPREPCAAGRVDPLTGDFMPTVEFNVPMQLGDIVLGTDLLVLASFALMQAELRAGAVVPVPGPSFKSRYGFIYLKSRSLSPATEAYMREVRAVEAEFVQRESRLARTYRALLE
jgi:DNA-binding transcriptional LysR family regulator